MLVICISPCSPHNAWFLVVRSRDLGLQLPEGEPGQEVVLGLLGRRVEVLRKRLVDMEREQRERLEAGQFSAAYILTVSSLSFNNQLHFLLTISFTFFLWYLQ